MSKKFWNDDIDISDYDLDLKPKKSRSKSRQTSDYEDLAEEKTIRIKQFDMNMISPHDINSKNGTKIVVIGKPGCFAPGTEVLMFDGSVKKIEDVQIGDLVMGHDFTSRKVLELFHDTQEMFQIQPINGSPYTVNKNHDLLLISQGLKGFKKNEMLEISVGEYLQKDKHFKNNYQVFHSSAVTCWKDQDIEIDPYFVGRLIGVNTNFFTSCDEKIIMYEDVYKECFMTSSFTMELEHKLENLFMNYVLIPEKYKISSINSRAEILAGIIDQIGYVKKRKGFHIMLDHRRTKLIKDIKFVANSLGLSVVTKELIDKNRDILHDLFIRQSREVKIQSRKFKPYLRELISFNHLSSNFMVNPKRFGEYYGFKLENDRRFLLANFEVVLNTGKSTIISDIIASKAHIIPVAQVFSGTEDSNHFYSEKMPSVCVYNKLDLNAIEQFAVRQKIAKEYLDNPWALQIIDDCTDDPKILKKPIFQAYYKNGRHWKMLHILSLQYCLDITPAIRTNIDYTFILREPNLSNREKLHKHFANCIDNFQDFLEIMDTVTEDYTALVINNTIQSNKIEDCVFWYKAEPDRLPSNWKFGHQTAWDFHHERMDPNYHDPYIV